MTLLLAFLLGVLLGWLARYLCWPWRLREGWWTLPLTAERRAMLIDQDRSE